MQNSNVKGHIVESGIFLVGYMVSSLVVLWGIGFGRLHQHGDTIVTYSILFGTLETLKILLRYRRAEKQKTAAQAAGA